MKPSGDIDLCLDSPVCYYFTDVGLVVLLFLLIQDVLHASICRYKHQEQENCTR